MVRWLVRWMVRWTARWTASYLNELGPLVVATAPSFIY
jgi:hypothetical protein